MPRSALIAKASEIDCLDVRMRSGAVFDRSEHYRYTLWRKWDDAAPRILFVMLNPSRANEEINDQTIRTCIGFAMHQNFGSMEVVNLFAYRTSDPRMLMRARNPIGEENDAFILEGCQRSSTIVLAWGNHGKHLDRSNSVISDLVRQTTQDLVCLGTTKEGFPRHPLYVKRTTDLTPYLISVAAPN
jgi:hypothetical protein